VNMILSGLKILTFHRVSYNSDYFIPPMVIQSKVFSRLVTILGKMKNIVDLDEIFYNSYENELHKDCVAITFDDAYIDNYQIAKQILERKGVPATFFVPYYPVENGKPYWWDHIFYVADKNKKRLIKWLIKKKIFNQATENGRFHGNHNTSILCRDIVRRLNEFSENDRQAFLSAFGQEFGAYNGERLLMNWDEIRQLKNNGFSIGSHSFSHVPLTDLSACKAQIEVKESKIRLEQKIGITVSGFSYPRGSYSAMHASIVEQAGYSYAVTTRFGSNLRGCNRYTLARRNVSDFRGLRSLMPVSMHLLESTGLLDPLLTKRR
jgi:peptidoglycan/xylan/chitin deacetylase (PgdA/CDA1 family)